MRTSMLRAFQTDQRGGVALVFGLVVPSLIAFAGLGVDGSYWLMERNKLQASTDNAAISAVQALALNGNDQVLTAEAKKLMGKVYGTSLTGVRVTVQHPPASGAMAGNASAVAVLAERDQPMFFLGMFGLNDSVVASRSVARVDSVTEACLLALSKNEDKAIEISGSSTVTLGCGLASNSNSSQAAYFSGSSNTKVTGVSTAGDVYLSTNGKLDTSGGPIKTHSAAATDPYGPEGRNLQVPTNPKNCAEKQLKVHNDTTLQPGRYCGGIDFIGGTTTFAPGTYIIDGGDFKSNGNAALVGNDVTFILTGTGAKIAQLDVNGGSDISLHAPKSGSNFNGILFFQDPARTQTNGSPSKMNGNANLNLSGAMYFPGDKLEVTGGTASNISCLQVIASTVKITGNSTITGTCDQNSGTDKISRSTVELVE